MSAKSLRAYLAKPEQARLANNRVADQAVRYHFIARVPMLCECSDTDCTTVVPIALGAYRELRRNPRALLTAPGHTVVGGKTQREEADYWLQRRG